MSKLFPCLLFGLGLFLSDCHYGTASRDTFPEEFPNSPNRPALTPPQSPFVDSLAEETTLLVPKPSLVNERPYQPSPYDRLVAENDWPTYIPYIAPTPLINPFEAYNQFKVELLTAIAKQFKNDIDTIKQRQEELKKHAESCPNKEGCNDSVVKEDDDNNKQKGYWHHWRPNGYFTQTDQLFYMVVSTKRALEKLTLRQNMLFEYISCSCPSNSSCSESVKPILNVMFSNNTNNTKEIVRSLFLPSMELERNVFTNFFSHIPNFSQWFGTFNFNPLSSLFGNNVGLFPYIFNPTLYTPGSFWGYFKPTYSTSVHTSSSSPGPDPSTVTSSTTSESSGNPGQENYVINHPGGGTTHISSSTGETGSSVSVVSTSDPSSAKRDARQLFFGEPPQAISAFANQDALGNLGSVSPGVPVNPPYFLHEGVQY